ncbi:RNA chaperone Hfq [Mannheimia haemolytica]
MVYKHAISTVVPARALSHNNNNQAQHAQPAAEVTEQAE